jgi:hypothetical protein
MNYLRNRYLRILLIFLSFTLANILMLKFRGTGFRPSITGGSGPLSWIEITHLYKSIILSSITFTVFFIYFDYWDYKRKTR